MNHSSGAMIDSMTANRVETISELNKSRDSINDVFKGAAIEIQELKKGMTNLQTAYAGELNSILLAMREFLIDVQRDLQQIMETTFDSESKKFFSGMYSFGATIDKKITQFNDTIVNIVDVKLNGVCDEIKDKTISDVTSSVSYYISRYDNSIASFNKHIASITEKMNAFNSSFDQKFENLSKIIESSYDCDFFKDVISDAVDDAVDVSSEIESVIDSYRFKDNVKDSVKDGLEDYFNYNSEYKLKSVIEECLDYNFENRIKNAVEECLDYNFENKVRSAIDYEIGSKISQIESDLSDIKYKMD